MQVVHTTQSTETAQSRRLRNAMTAGASLRRWFGTGFTVLESQSGHTLQCAPDQPNIDWTSREAILRQAVQGGRATFIEEEDPVVALAVPLGDREDSRLLAVGVFLSRSVSNEAEIERAARIFEMPSKTMFDWAREQKPVNPDMLERMADLAASKLAADMRVEDLELETEELSAQISSTFEEISLIYRLTQNLKISSNINDLERLALDWLADAVPVEGLAIHNVPSLDNSLPADEQSGHPFVTQAHCPVSHQEFAALLAHLELSTDSRPTVINAAVTSQPEWPFKNVRQLVLVPMTEGERLFGWLAAFNHEHGLEFGTSEASLMGTVGTILGIHVSNVDLYRRQAQVFASIVRAMSSAIDAKDPYTRGHSDRVARVAVRLAQKLGCEQETVKTIYMAGLLHDIGKIGIDDNVLRKPGKLTDAEYEHVKTHVEIGYRILKDLPGMGAMLPVVLHHHESWDGSGYPYGLAGKNIPYLARIAAVADAYDAMSSDRPYRSGMPDEKLDGILRDGAGKQWDPEVIEAFFAVRDDIRSISNPKTAHQEPISLQWT